MLSAVIIVNGKSFRLIGTTVEIESLQAQLANEYGVATNIPEVFIKSETVDALDCIPTGQPSSEPTYRPTSFPTQPGDTNPPTAHPTMIPSSVPSSIPSASPSIDLDSVDLDVMHEAYRDIRNSTHGQIEFSNFVYKGYSIEGSCDDWDVFRKKALHLPFPNVDISSVSIFYGYRENVSAIVHTDTAVCEDPVASALIVNNIQTSEPHSIVCQNRTWDFFSCGGVYQLCVDCYFDHDYNETTAQKPRECPDFSSTVINPCEKGDVYEVYFSVLSVEISEKVLYPKILETITDVGVSTISVTVRADAEGLVYCAGYLSSDLPLTSVSRLKLDGAGSTLTFLNSSMNNNTSTLISLENLDPDSNYSIYCYSEDAFGNKMDLKAALATYKPARTLCCRRIVLRNTSPRIVFYSPLVPEFVFSFYLNAQVRYTVQVGVSLDRYNCSSHPYAGGSSAAASFPSEFVLQAGTPSGVGYNFVVRGDPGCYRLLLSSASVNGYGVDNSFLNASTKLQILSPDSNIPPPHLMSATFSSDGRKIQLDFDAATDRGMKFINNIFKQFPCSSLIVVKEGISGLRCIWETDSTLLISLISSKKEFVNIGDEVKLLNGKIKAACPQGMSCSDFNYSTEDSVEIAPPLVATYPFVSLQVSSATLSNCSDLEIDPSQSFNKGGAHRPWLRVHWTVSGSGGDTVEIENQLNAYYANHTVTPFTVLSEFLRVGSLTFTLSLKNFFGKEGITSTTVTIIEEAIPAASVFGPSVFEMNRWATLELHADGSFQNCYNDTGELHTLSYKWAGYNGVVLDPTLLSTSLNPRIFRLNPYTLDVGSTYSFVSTVAVDDTANSIPVIYTTKVNVIRSGVQAEIAGGELRSVTSSELFLLDASGSSDLDYPESPLTTFAWSCVEESPIFGRQCNTTFSSDSSQYVDSSYLAANSTTDMSFLFTVSVRGYDGLVATATAAVKVLIAAHLPRVNVVGLNRKYSVSKKVVLSCTVATTADTLVTWNSSNVDLGIAASTALSRFVSAQSSITFRLSLKSHTLNPGEYYTFQFLSSGVHNNFSDSTLVQEIKIHMNEPPSDGYLTVIPSTGFAFNTTFLLSSLNWDDDVADYPLKYVIQSYNDNRDSATILKTRSSIPSVKSTIPQGLKLKRYFVTCEVIVSDVYGSFGVANSSVIVKPLPSSQLQIFATGQLTVALESFDPDLALNVISSTVSALNAADCSLAPDCASLNRYSCGSSPNTCGICKSGFTGVPGDSNEACFLQSEVVGFGERCTANTMCSTGLCRNGTCQFRNKECIADCTHRKKGECFAFDYNGQIMTDNCTYGNFYCSAKCVCGSGWKGEACSIGIAEYNAAAQLREQMCEGLLQLASVTDALSEDIIISRARSVAALLSDPTVMTLPALHNCTAALTQLVLSNENAELLSADDVGISILQSLSKVNEARSMLSLRIIQDVLDSVNILTIARQASQVVGSEVTSLITDGIRLSVLKEYFSSASGLSVFTPTTEYEIVYGNKLITAVLLQSDNVQENSAASVALSENTNLEGDTLSNPVDIMFDLDFSELSGRRMMSSDMKLTITLPNYRPINYSNHDASYKVLGCTRRGDSLPYNLTITCEKTRTRHNIECPGNKPGSLHFSCPTNFQYPQCLIYNGSEFKEDASCTVDRYNITHVTCVCGQAGNLARMLQTGSSSGGFSLTTGSKEEWTTFEVLWAPHMQEVPQLEEAINASYYLTTLFLLVLFILSPAFFVLVDKRSDRRGIYESTNRNIFAAVLPVELTEISWGHRLIEKCRDNTILCGLFSKKCSFRHIIKILLLFLTILFINVTLAFFLYNDDGSCALKSTKYDCLDSDRGFLGKWQHACLWNMDDYCTFDQTHDNYESILKLAVAVLLISLPVMSFLDYCVEIVCNNLDLLKGSSFKNSFSKIFADEFEDKEAGAAYADAVGSSWHTASSDMIIAARIDVMRSKMDYTSVAEEARQTKLIQDKKLFFNKLSMERCVRNESISPGEVEFKSNQTVVEKKILKARSLALEINCDMNTLRGDDAKELLLFRYFLAASLPHGRGKLARRYLINSSLTKNAKFPDESKMHAYQFLLVVYCSLLFVALFKSGNELNSSAVSILAKVTISTFCGYLILLELSFTYIVYIALASLVRSDVLRLRDRLQSAGHLIMTRRNVLALIREKFIGIHHFNAACRVARIRPKYFISRLLVQLNDWDMPTTFAPSTPYSSGVFFLVARICTVLPTVLGDMCIKGFLVIFWGSLCYALFALYLVSEPLFFALALGVGFLGLSVYHRAKKQNKESLRAASKRKEEYRSSVANQLLSQREKGDSTRKPWFGDARISTVDDKLDQNLMTTTTIQFPNRVNDIEAESLAESPSHVAVNNEAVIKPQDVCDSSDELKALYNKSRRSDSESASFRNEISREIEALRKENQSLK